jgi:CRP-like cAMP-binding protein
MMNWNNLLKLFERGEIIHFKRQSILNEGGLEYRKGIYLINKGAVKIFNARMENNFFLSVAMEGEIIGLDTLYSKNTNAKVYQTIKNTELVFCSLATLEKELQKNPELHFDILQYLSHRSDQLELRIFNMQHKSVTENFADLLLSLNKPNLPNIVPYIISTSDIANMIGTTKNYVYKTIQKLENRSAISFKDRKLRIVNKALLKKISTEKENSSA